MPLPATVRTTRPVRDLVERMLKSSGRRVDLSSPFVDAVLPDGSRLREVDGKWNQVPEALRPEAAGKVQAAPSILS